GSHASAAGVSSAAVVGSAAGSSPVSVWSSPPPHAATSASAGSSMATRRITLIGSSIRKARNSAGTIMSYVTCLDEHRPPAEQLVPLRLEQLDLDDQCLGHRVVDRAAAAQGLDRADRGVQQRYGRLRSAGDQVPFRLV